jgi:hypothetical protein
MMIHTREQLIGWIEKHVDDPVLHEALLRGTVEVLGGFDPLPTSKYPGWMVQVISRFNTKYLIAVACADFALHWFRAPHIEWDKWNGFKSDNPLFQGDRPKIYEELKMAWEGYDPRFVRIARRSELYPETDGSDSRLSKRPTLDS